MGFHSNRIRARSNVIDAPPPARTPFLGDDPAPERPVLRDTLSGLFPLFRDPVFDDLNADAYQIIRRADATAQPILKLAYRVASLQLRVEGDGERARAVQTVVDQIPHLGDTIRDFVWAVVEGVRFGWIKATVTAQGWAIPEITVRKKVKAGGVLEWDGKRVIKVREFVSYMSPQANTNTLDARLLDRSRVIVYRPGSGPNPEGETDLAWMLYLLAEASQLHDKNEARYAERFGLPREIVRKYLQNMRPTDIPAVLSTAADKLEAANRHVVALNIKDIAEILEPKGQTATFLEKYRAKIESRAHKLILMQTLTTDTKGAGPVGSANVHLKEEDMVVWCIARSIAETFTQDLLPFILKFNAHKIPDGDPVRFVFQNPAEQVEVTPIEAVQVFQTGQRFSAKWWYGQLGTIPPPGTPDVIQFDRQTEKANPTTVQTVPSGSSPEKEIV